MLLSPAGGRSTRCTGCALSRRRETLSMRLPYTAHGAKARRGNMPHEADRAVLLSAV